MFEIRDPDGHTLWFGQSYNQPDASPKSEMMQQALPELPFDDVHAAVRYYHDVLGFGINYQQDDLGVMFRDRITVLLIPRTERHTGIGSFEVYVENADRLYEELRAKGGQPPGRAGQPSLGTARLQRAGPGRQPHHLRSDLRVIRSTQGRSWRPTVRVKGRTRLRFRNRQRP